MPSGQGWGCAPVAELDTGLAFPIPTHLRPPPPRGSVHTWPRAWLGARGARRER